MPLLRLLLLGNCTDKVTRVIAKISSLDILLHYKKEKSNQIKFSAWDKAMVFNRQENCIFPTS